MILICAIVPALILCLAILYAVLIQRFFTVKAKLPVLGVRGALSRTVGKRRKLAALGALFFTVCLVARLASAFWMPDMRMVFSYEEAARGQNPNVTRFNESNILSDDILEQVIRRGGLKLSVEQLSECLSISTPLDAEKLDVSQESDLKISTEYHVRCSERVSLYRTDPKTVLNLLADVYWENFVRNYAENDSILDLSFEKLEDIEYLDVKDYLEMQANKLRNYLPGYSAESSSFRAEGNEETFASLSRKISNFIDIELERYEAFVLENGLAGDRTTYQSRMQYANRRLDVSKRKEMAAHDVRIEAINMYNAYMTRFVLIPTYDTDKEFYMSKTKVGVDYFADEAKEHLEFATKLVEEMEHNTYASRQIGGSSASASLYDQAEQRIEALKTELLNLAAQSRELCGAYVQEKRDGYIQVSFTAPNVLDDALKALGLTALFVAALGGNAVLKPFYREYRNDRNVGRRGRREETLSKEASA
ncbi:MAG: hypothetical protein HFF56_00365 [Lawsonibacter sp.]|nr:hypothetical protein [Lawsonibacter sp.]